MPYVAIEERIPLDEVPSYAGQLNYVITTICNNYLWSQPDKLSYNRLNEVIGVLECAKLEMYRRVVTPYEDGKIIENGDVY